MIRIARIDEDVVHDHVRAGHALEALAAVQGFVKPLGGSGINHVAIRRVLFQHARSARGVGNALDLLEQLGRVHALVNPAACAGENSLSIGRIDDDRKYVRVVDDALLDVAPGLAAVRGLPRQMPCARVDHIGVRWVDGQRLHLMNLPAPRRTDLRPGDAGIRAAENPFERSGKEHGGIRGRLGKGANRLAAQALGRAPAPPSVMAHPQPAAGLVQLPRGYIDSGGVRRIHDDVVQNQIVGRVQLREPMPGRAPIQ